MVHGCCHRLRHILTLELSLLNEYHVALGSQATELIEVLHALVHVVAELPRVWLVKDGHVVLLAGLEVADDFGVDLSLRLLWFVRDEHHNDVHVLVLVVQEALQVLGLVVRTKDKHNPLDRAHDPVVVQLMDLILLDGTHMVERVPQRQQRLPLHLLVTLLRLKAAESMLLKCRLVLLLQILREII